MNNLIKFLFLYFVLTVNLFANNCLTAYVAPLQTHDDNNNKKIKFECGAQIQNYTSSNLLPTKGVDNPSGPCAYTCESANCFATGKSQTLNLGNFQSTSNNTKLTVNEEQTVTVGLSGDNEFKEIKVEEEGILNFSSNSSVYKIKKLILKEDSVVNFTPGKYWIEEIDFNDDGVEFKVVGDNTVELYVEDDIDIDKVAKINFSTTSSNPSKNLFIYSYGDFTITKSNSYFKGVVYSKGKVTIKKDINIAGAFSAEEIVFEENSTVNFDSTAISILDSNTICGSAGACQATFTNGLQTHGNNKKLEFKCGAKIINPSSTNVKTDEIDLDSNAGSCLFTCGTQHCQATGTEVNPIDVGSYKFTSSSTNLTLNNGQTYTVGQSGDIEFKKITLNDNSTLNFASVAPQTLYKINKIRTKANTTINLVAGDYWIEDLDIDKDNLVINVNGPGTARVFFYGNIHLRDKIIVNANSGESNPSKKIWLYSFNDLRVDNTESVIYALLYSKKHLRIEKGVTFTGAGVGREITVEEDATVIYDPIAVQALDWGSTCPPVGSGVTHFIINHDANGVHCFLEPITVTAMDGANVATNYTGTIVLDTQSGKGTWTLQTGNGTLTDITSNDGLATYTFNSSDNGVATFSLDYQDGPSVINIKTYDQGDPSITDDNSEGNLTFAPSGFLITATEVGGSVPPSYNENIDAGFLDKLYIAAYGISPGDPNCGIIQNYNGSKNLKFWVDYINPNSGTKVPVIENTGIGTSEGGAVSISVPFTSGKAEVDMRYRDVGMIRINIKDDSTTNAVLGSTNNFVVKPAKFVITSIPTNPVATSADGLVFKAAGESFTVNVEVRDIDDNITPNYGNESSPEGIKLVSSTLVLPIDGRNGSLNNGKIQNDTAFTKVSPGVFQGTTFNFDEVGIIKLTASVASGSYLGGNNTSGPESDNVGRFIPDNFDVTGNTPIFDAACISGAFSYIGQPFLYNVDPEINVTAKSKLNNTTANYKNDFWKLTMDGKVTYNQNHLTLVFNSTNAITDIQFTDNQDGTGKFVFSDGGGLYYDKPIGINELEFFSEIELSLDVTDSDSVAYISNPFKFGGTGVGEGILFNGGNSIRQGRMVASNAIGSELLDLTMNYSVEYYTVDGFQLNTNDSCSTSLSVSSIFATYDPPGIVTNITVNPVINGVGSILFSPTNQYGSAEIELDLSATGANMPWLQFDWSFDGNQDGVFDDNPRARADFGLYGGNEEVIYFREVY